MFTSKEHCALTPASSTNMACGILLATGTWTDNLGMHSHDIPDADLFVGLAGGYGSTWTKKA